MQTHKDATATEVVIVVGDTCCLSFRASHRVCARTGQRISLGLHTCDIHRACFRSKLDQIAAQPAIHVDILVLTTSYAYQYRRSKIGVQSRRGRLKLSDYRKKCVRRIEHSNTVVILSLSRPKLKHRRRPDTTLSEDASSEFGGTLLTV